jgi:hypothetical protein
MMGISFFHFWTTEDDTDAYCRGVRIVSQGSFV